MLWDKNLARTTDEVLIPTSTLSLHQWFSTNVPRHTKVP